MPHPFKSYEVEVLKLLLEQEFPEPVLMQVLETASTTQVDYTNYGFYVSIGHSSIGRQRRVFSGAGGLFGQFGGQIAAFVVFLETDELTLESFPVDGEALPATFRDSPVQLLEEYPNENV